MTPANGPILTPAQERERKISRRRRRVAELEAEQRYAIKTGDAERAAACRAKIWHQQQELRKLGVEGLAGSPSDTPQGSYPTGRPGGYSVASPVPKGPPAA